MLSDYYPDQLTAYFQFEISAQIIQAIQVHRRREVSDSRSKMPGAATRSAVRPISDQSRSDPGDDLACGNTEEAKLAATTLFTLPGLPFVYYGEEIGMTGNKPDPRLRTPMQWTSDATGFTTGIPWEPFQDDLETINVASQTDDPDSLLNHYRTLIDLHLSQSALAHGETFFLDSPSPSRRVHPPVGRPDLLVVLNFDDEAVRRPSFPDTMAGLPPGAYELTPLLGSAIRQPLTVNAERAKSRATRASPSLAPTTGYIFELMASS